MTKFRTLVLASCALGGLMVTQPARANPDHPASEGGAVAVSREAMKEKMRERHEQLMEEIDAWRQAHPNRPLPPDLADRMENAHDHREDVRDRAEDARDHREDVMDRREDILDRQTDTGPGDRAEDIRDRAEDRADHREDVRDRTENRRDRAEDVRDHRK